MKSEWDDGDFEIHFLDVGQGDGTFIICPEGECILVDLGSKKNGDIAGSDAVTFLVDTLNDIQIKRGLSNPTIDLMVLTHGDGDHYNLIPQLLNSFDDDPLDVYLLAIGGPKSDYGDANSEIREFINTQDANDALVDLGDNVRDAANHPRYTYSTDLVQVYILSANYPQKNGGSKNAKSVVLMIVYQGRKIILTGDAEAPTEGEILLHYNAAFLQCDALKLGHHGSKNGTSANWLAALQPKMAFASSDMKWAHPYCEVIKRVSDTGNLWQAMFHWWLCGAGAGVTKNYYNHFSKCGVYSALAFQIQLNQEDMEDDEMEVNDMLIDQADEDPVNDPLPDGLVQGAHYTLFIYPKGPFQAKGDVEVAYAAGNMAGSSGRANAWPQAICDDAAATPAFRSFSDRPMRELVVFQ
ncbi:MAG TPA: MBL fold metallo-hydrolase [Fimbriimonadaceae bacterium]|nr:MBL fold metallo-hydrolase [Fimbriimonadaceae bacterium]